MSLILITRTLVPESKLLGKLNSKLYQVEGISFVKFKSIQFEVIPKAEWIFFYSRNGVDFFISQLNDIKLLKDYKLAAIGVGTAATLKERDLEPDFVGNGQPDKVAEQFFKECNPESVLFPKAENSKNSIRNLIEGKCICYDLNVYSNEPEGRLINTIPDCIVFTSPLNVEGFFRMNQIPVNCKIISIGPSTTKKLKGYYLKDIIESPTPDDEMLYNTIVNNQEI